MLACIASALVPALLPGYGFETLGAWANLQWVMVYGLAFVLLVPPERSGRVVASLYAFGAVGGGAASVFVLPLVFLHGRSWYRHPAVPGVVLGAVYQVVARAGPQRVPRRRPGSPAQRPSSCSSGIRRRRSTRAPVSRSDGSSCSLVSCCSSSSSWRSHSPHSGGEDSRSSGAAARCSSCFRSSTTSQSALRRRRRVLVRGGTVHEPRHA